MSGLKSPPRFPDEKLFEDGAHDEIGTSAARFPDEKLLEGGAHDEIGTGAARFPDEMLFEGGGHDEVGASDNGTGTEPFGLSFLGLPRFFFIAAPSTPIFTGEAPTPTEAAAAPLWPSTAAAPLLPTTAPAATAASGTWLWDDNSVIGIM